MERYKKEDKTSYTLGMSLTIEALKNHPDKLFQIVLSNKAIKNQQLEYLLSLADINNIDVVYDDKIIDKLSLKENCYCIGFINKYQSELSSNKHILLYEFNDYGDLGTILRSAVSFDFKDIVLINSNIDYFDPRCIRASMGGIFHCNIVKYTDIDTYLNDYPKQKIYPFLSKGSKELSDCLIDENYSLLIPENYYALDNKFDDGYYIKHHNLDEISLAIRSSIIFEYVYNQKRNR